MDSKEKGFFLDIVERFRDKRIRREDVVIFCDKIELKVLTEKNKKIFNLAKTKFIKDFQIKDKEIKINFDETFNYIKVICNDKKHNYLISELLKEINKEN